MPYTAIPRTRIIVIFQAVVRREAKARCWLFVDLLWALVQMSGDLFEFRHRSVDCTP